jgi:winged helix DNA-binding protein
MTAAELSIGVRVEVTRKQVRSALWEERTLAKTYGIRGAIHVFPAAELPLWMAARRARAELQAPQDARRLSYTGLRPEQMSELVEAMAEALEGCNLTLRELGEEVVRRTGAWAAESTNVAWISGWPNWRHGLGSAATAGVLCFGPNRGAQVTFVRPDQWFSSWQPVDPAQALREVLRRYLRAYGPATPAQFAQWFDLPVPAVRRLAESMGDELDEVVVEGERLIAVSENAGLEVPETARSVRLLPHFDCYLRGFHPRGQLVAGHAERAAGGTGSFPILLIDGMVAGVWERRTRGRRLQVTVDPFRKLGREHTRELEREAARIGAFDETEADLTVGPVKVRAHL